MWRIIRRCLGRESMSSVEPMTEPSTRNFQGNREPETTLLYLRIPLRQPTTSSAANAPVPQAASDNHASDNNASDNTSAVHASAANQPDPRASRRDRVTARRRASHQRALRFAKHFTDMDPREAHILMAMHRRSPSVLARESAAVLKRDWERFLLSSPGQRLAAGSEVPDIMRLRGWITLARAKVSEAAATKQSQSPAVTPPGGGSL